MKALSSIKPMYCSREYNFTSSITSMICSSTLNAFIIWMTSHCSFQHKPTKVFANCTFLNTPGRVSDSREGTTFITHACANGTYMPPVIVVKGKTPKSLMGYNTLDGPKGAFWTYQQEA